MKKWYFMGIVFLAVLLTSAGFYYLKYEHRRVQLSQAEIQTANSELSSEIRIVDLSNQMGRNNPTKALGYLNMAGLYAKLGQCSQANSALANARKFVTADLQTSLSETTTFVQKNCH
jgi:cytochrome c-type biogenesis protein CcmH/NrfG